jgi:hypothetical protein
MADAAAPAPAPADGDRPDSSTSGTQCCSDVTGANVGWGVGCGVGFGVGQKDVA